MSQSVANSQDSALSSSGSSASVKPTGTCPVCRKGGIRITKGGVLYNHGHRGQECAGYGGAPLSAGLGIVPGGPSTSALQPPESAAPPLTPLYPPGHQSPPTIKWIPRGARSPCAALLTQLLRGVVSDVDRVDNWVKLLAFGRVVLFRPPRGGHQRNLSNIISRRCRDFDTLLNSPSPFDTNSKPWVLTRARKGDPHTLAMTILARGVSSRLEEGNFKGAVRLLSSQDKPAPDTPAIFQALVDKHPSAPTDRRPPPPSNPLVPPITFSESMVHRAILSFPAGSTGGTDGLTPQHLKDLISAEGSSSPLLAAITSLVNLIASGNIPGEIRPTLFGGRLVALEKKDGGVRPIVIGLVLRRLASKLVARYAQEKLAPVWSPLQLGVGVQGGVEAAVHAARRYVLNINPDKIIVKLDFSNAFNSIRRDAILEVIESTLPDIYDYVQASYADASSLRFGSHVVVSDEGVQQGDPLGPLLFCAVIHPLLTNCKAELRIGFLDDITIGGEVETVAADVDSLRMRASNLGLQLNVQKCEAIGSTPPLCLPDSLAGFRVLGAADASLLGSPLLPGPATDACLSSHTDTLKLAAERLPWLQAHDALVLLRHSLSTPKLLHNLRSAVCVGHPSLSTFDDVLRDCLCRTLNVTLDDPQWDQASLPVKRGGLGIRKSVQLAPSAYLASATASAALISLILPAPLRDMADPFFDEALTAWRNAGGSTPPIAPAAARQRSWDAPVLQQTVDRLFSSAPDDYSRARLLAVSSPHSGEWLLAAPISSVGLRLSNDAIRVAVGLRLGSNLCNPHTCKCGAQVDARGAHGLSCQYSAGRFLRHSSVNDLIHRALGRAKLPAVKEPLGLSGGSNLRPDGATYVPWVRGKCLAWDFTSPDTLAPSHLPTTSSISGAAAEHAADQKTIKYRAILPTHHFVPIAIESLGAWNAEGLSFVRELGRRITLVTGDVRESFFLLQRLSVAVQIGNSVSVLGSLPPCGE